MSIQPAAIVDGGSAGGPSLIRLGWLADPPDNAATIDIDREDLCDVRDFVRRRAMSCGLSATRADDLVLATNEIATNSLVHTPDGRGVLRVWPDYRSVVCEVRDRGHIVDPLVGQRPPDLDSDHGRGIWMASQLCNLVQLSSNPDGTTVRMHVRDNLGSSH